MNENYRVEGTVGVNQPSRSYGYMTPTDSPSLQGLTIPTPWQGGIPFRHPCIQVEHTAATSTNIPQGTLAARRVVLPQKIGNQLPAQDCRFPDVLPQRISKIGESQISICQPTQYTPLSKSEKPNPYATIKNREASNSHYSTQTVLETLPYTRQFPLQVRENFPSINKLADKQ